MLKKTMEYIKEEEYQFWTALFQSLKLELLEIL